MWILPGHILYGAVPNQLTIFLIMVGHWPLTRYAGNVLPAIAGSDPDMHHGTCVTHVPWCMLESLMSGFLWSWWRGKRSRHSWPMHNLQIYVSSKRPMANTKSRTPVTLIRAWAALIELDLLGSLVYITSVFDNCTKQNINNNDFNTFKLQHRRRIDILKCRKTEMAKSWSVNIPKLQQAETSKKWKPQHFESSTQKKWTNWDFGRLKRWQF